MDLASFVNSWGAVEEEDTGLRWMRIGWIGADLQYTDFHVAGTRTSVAQEKTNEVTSEASDPTIPKRHHPLRLSLGHTCPNACPPEETDSVAVVALVVLPVIRRLIDELSLRLLVDRLPVAIPIHTLAIHYPQRRRFLLYPSQHRQILQLSSQMVRTRTYHHFSTHES